MDKIKIYPQYCKSCGICLEICPFDALLWNPEIVGIYGEKTPKVDNEKCRQCLLCEIHCPDCAVLVEQKGWE